MLKIEITAPDLSDLGRIDMGVVTASVATAMRDHWRAGMFAGANADGSPLPVNERGEPLGVGSGTILDGWEVSQEGTTAVVAPYQGGKYAKAVEALHKRGVIYHSLAGESANVFDAALASAVDQALSRVKVRR